MQKKRLGFSLIELLVVITIIAVLTTLGMVTYTNTSKKTRDAKRKSDLQTVRQALVLYRADLGDYPAIGNFDSMLQELRDEGYISNDLIQDPKNSDPYVYQYASDGVTFTLDCTYEVDPLESCALSNP